MFHCDKMDKEWKVEDVSPFNELILSWNGDRPMHGTIDFFLSVKLEEWSPWIHYASWGTTEQTSFNHTLKDCPVQVFQDTLNILDEKKATGFQVEIKSNENPSIRKLHVFTNGDSKKEESDKTFQSLLIPLKGISQMKLDHPRNRDLCSPTSTSCVIHYLAPGKLLNLETAVQGDKVMKDFELESLTFGGGHSQKVKAPPIVSDYSSKDCVNLSPSAAVFRLKPETFAEHVWDKGFNIYGNWVFNVAQASVELGNKWECWIERLEGFHRIIACLKERIPVIVSVRGPLAGSPSPYEHGHLLIVIGYDASQHTVICMDPAFPTDEETRVSYDFSDFMEAWNRRGRIAYIFSNFL